MTTTGTNPGPPTTGVRRRRMGGGLTRATGTRSSGGGGTDTGGRRGPRVSPATRDSTSCRSRTESGGGAARTRRRTERRTRTHRPNPPPHLGRKTAFRNRPAATASTARGPHVLIGDPTSERVPPAVDG